VSRAQERSQLYQLTFVFRALEWGPWEWQSTQFYSENRTGYSPYYRFCDYIEGVWPNSTNAVPGAKGVGLTKALENYAKYVREQVVAGCMSLPFPYSLS
jgi:hypothetical protein